MKRLALIVLLVTMPSCTLIGLGAGAAFDAELGTGHIGKDIGLRIGLGVDLSVVTMMMAMFGQR